MWPFGAPGKLARGGSALASVSKYPLTLLAAAGSFPILCSLLEDVMLVEAGKLSQAFKSQNSLWKHKLLTAPPFCEKNPSLPSKGRHLPLPSWPFSHWLVPSPVGYPNGFVFLKDDHMQPYTVTMLGSRSSKQLGVCHASSSESGYDNLLKASMFTPTLSLPCVVSTVRKCWTEWQWEGAVLEAAQRDRNSGFLFGRRPPLSLEYTPVLFCLYFLVSWILYSSLGGTSNPSLTWEEWGVAEDSLKSSSHFLALCLTVTHKAWRTRSVHLLTV